MKNTLLALFLCCISASAFADSVADHYTLVDISLLSQYPANFFFGLLNDKGEIAGSFFDPQGKRHSYFYSNEKFKDIQALTNTEDAAIHGLNNKGQLVGAFVTKEKAVHAFLYSDDQLHDLGIVASPYEVTQARSINDAGQIVGDSSEPGLHGRRNGFLYENGVMKFVEEDDDIDADIFCINNAGLIVGTCHYKTDHKTKPCLYLNGQKQKNGPNLDRISNSSSIAVNDRAVMIGQIVDDPLRPIGFASWSGVVGNIGNGYMYETTPKSINYSGQIVGSFSERNLTVGKTVKNSVHAFICQKNRYLDDLNSLTSMPEGMVLIDATSINTSGQIAAIATINNERHVVLLTPIQK